METLALAPLLLADLVYAPVTQRRLSVASWGPFPYKRLMAVWIFEVYGTFTF